MSNNKFTPGFFLHISAEGIYILEGIGPGRHPELFTGKVLYVVRKMKKPIRLPQVGDVEDGYDYTAFTRYETYEAALAKAKGQ